MQKFFKVYDSNKSVFVFTLILCFQMQGFSGFAQLNDTQHKIRTIVIDAGHGGKDTGALGKKAKEKDVALSISLLAGKYIEENMPEVKVVYTRTTDIFIPLHERAKIANDINADLFISVHVNSNGKPTPSGTSTHVLGLHRMNENFEVAKRENSVILMEEDYKSRYENFDPSSPESYIMFSLMQDVYFDQSIHFGQLVQNQFRDRAKRKDRGVKQQGLLVLAQTSMPGVLIETGFISNPTEEEYLMSEQGKEYIASAIYRAFRDYKEFIEGSNTNTQLEATTIIQEKASPEKKEHTNDTLILSSPEVIETGRDNEADSTTDIGTFSNKDTIVYKVQILYSERSVNLVDDEFADFNDVEEIAINGNFKYVVGSKNNYKDAVEYSKWVKSRYPDAFVVAVSNGKIIPLSEAMKKN